jgi:hypothetical protein
MGCLVWLCVYSFPSSFLSLYLYLYLYLCAVLFPVY